VHEPWDESLEQLSLPEDDRRLVPHANGDVAGPRGRLPRADETREKESAPREEGAGDRDRDDERDRRGDARG
jgi:hypothetical protein